MSFKRMSQSVQDLPPATRASEHQMLPPFPRPTGQHVDTKITKFQEDSDCFAEGNICSMSGGVKKQTKVHCLGKGQLQGERYIEENIQFYFVKDGMASWTY